MDNDRYMQALRQRSAVMPYGMPVSSDPEASDAYGEGVVRGVAKNLRARAGDFINALRSPMETLGGIVETGKQIVRDPIGSVRAMAQAEALRAANTASGPEAAGEYAASFFDPLRFAGVLRRNPVMSELDVYHATPHRFEPTANNPLGEFDASKIGTGEGAQAFGHGIYTAESPKIAQSYYDQFKQRIQGSFDTVIDRRLDAFMQEFGGDVQKAADRFMAGVYDTPKNKAAMRKEVLERLEARTRQPYMLKADLPDEMIDRMLDWDKPLSEQSPAVREALMPLVKDAMKKRGTPDRALEYSANRAIGSDIVKNLLVGNGVTRAEVSRRLQQAGIPGIKYLDAGSRGQGGSGTRNFVVFPGEEKKVRILERKE